MASIQEYKTKLKSLENTEKMTGTMKLVSASKLRQAHQAQSRAQRYARELTAVIARLAASVESASHPLLTPREKVNNVLFLVLSSDKGLCGGFNNSLNRRVLGWMNEQRKVYERVDVSCCGKRSFMFFKKHAVVKKYYENVVGKPEFLRVEQIGEELSELFLLSQYDEIYLAYNRFHSPLSQEPVKEKLLPIESQSLLSGGEALPSDYLFEPEKTELLKLLIPRFLYFRLFYVLLENSAGEHGARMTAMEQASQNTGELIDKYTLLRNRARQAAITTELTEIVAGAEALK